MPMDADARSSAIIVATEAGRSDVSDTSLPGFIGPESPIGASHDNVPNDRSEIGRRRVPWWYFAVTSTDHGSPPWTRGLRCTTPLPVRRSAGPRLPAETWRPHAGGPAEWSA